MPTRVESLLKFAPYTSTCIDGKWVPVRPERFNSVIERIKDAWLVLTGKADAVVWPGGQ